MPDAKRAPEGLEAAGRALWRNVVGDLAEGWTLDERERAILYAACRQRDDVARLESAVKEHGAMTTGSAGQPVVNPAVTEARQGRLALGRLLGSLHLPDEDEQPRTVAGKRGQRAARARWDREAEKWGRARG